MNGATVRPSRRFRFSFLSRFVSNSAAPARPVFECSPLEGRSYLASVFPTVYEQYSLQILNRARANPTAEVTRIGPGAGWEGTPGINEGVPAGTWGPEPRQPLAWNGNIGDAARKHSQYMAANNVFAHTVTINGQSVGVYNRLISAGYTSPTTFGENLAKTIAGDPTAAADTLHQLLFVDAGIASRGHRALILNGGVNEAGLGLADGPSNGSTFTYLTENAGNQGKGSFLVGVTIQDLNNDQFYQPGEQIGGVTITATRTSDNQVFSTTTWDAGGYALKLDPGTYTVTATGGTIGTPAPKTIIIGTQNVAADFIAASAAPAAPVIVTQPKDLQPFLSQTTASFSVAATGNPTPTVQWQTAATGSNTFTDIPGATGFTYTFTHQPTQNGNRFRAVLTNTVGSVTSNPATLFVQNGTPIPLNVTKSPGDQTVNVGDTVALSAIATGQTSAQWALSTDGGQNFTDIAGATSLTYTFTATSAMNGNRYRLYLSNSSGGRQYFSTITVNSNTAPPAIVVQPQPTTVTPAQTTPITVVPTAFPDPDIQWQEFDPNATQNDAFARRVTGGWVNVAGGTEATLNVTLSKADKKKRFRVILSNDEGTVTSDVITVKVNSKPVVSNDLSSLNTAASVAVKAVEQCKKSTRDIISKLSKDLKRLKASKADKAVLTALSDAEKSSREQFTKNLKTSLKAIQRAASDVEKNARKLQKKPTDTTLLARLQASLSALQTAADSQTVAVDATNCKLATLDQLAALSAIAPDDVLLQTHIEAAQTNAFTIGQTLQAPMSIALAIVNRLQSHAQS